MSEAEVGRTELKYIFFTNKKKKKRRVQISGTVVNQASPQAEASERKSNGMNVRMMKWKEINEREKLK
jgi:hypothetical protein